MEYRVNGKKERPTVLKVLNEHNTQHHLPLLSTAANITASDVQRAITIKSDWLRAVKSGHARIEFTPSAAPASAKGKLVTASAAEILLEVNAVWSTTTRTHEALRPALPAQLLPTLLLVAELCPKLLHRQHLSSRFAARLLHGNNYIAIYSPEQDGYSSRRRDENTPTQ